MILLVTGINSAKAHEDQPNERGQLVKDEGIRYEPYKDIFGKWHIGIGHLIKPGESFGTISKGMVYQIFDEDYSTAHLSVHNKYPWATGEVALVLTNMTFQLGIDRLSKFKRTLHYLRGEKYKLAAGEMLASLWAIQTPSRASRLAVRVLQVGVD